MRKLQDKPNWQAMENDYRAGSTTLYLIAKQYGIAYSVLKNRARRDLWLVDLPLARSPEDNLEGVDTDVEIAKSMAFKTVVASAGIYPASLARSKLLDDISQTDQFLRKLMEELKGYSDDSELFKELGNLLEQVNHDENYKGKLDRHNKIYQHVISLPARVKIASQLARVMGELHHLKVKFQSIEKEKNKSSEIDKALNAIAERKAQGVKADSPGVKNPADPGPEASSR